MRFSCLRNALFMMKNGQRIQLNLLKLTLIFHITRFISGAGIRRNKWEKNKDILKIPTIDEFGGYWKFQKENEKSIPKSEEVDYNEQVNKIDLDWANEEAKRQLDRDKINKNSDNENEESDFWDPSDQSLSLHLKKEKRHRYWSDVTNATSSGKLLSKCRSPEKRLKPIIKLNPFAEDSNCRDFNFDTWNIDNFDNFWYVSMENNSDKGSNVPWNLQVGDSIGQNFTNFNNSLEISNYYLQPHEELDHSLFLSHHSDMAKHNYRDDIEKFFWEN